jgi:hypothetical protein
MRRGLYLAPFDELANPRILADLASHAEARGRDGMFLWDRISYPPPGRAVADAWVALSAIASMTERLRLGPMIMPLSRRRVHKVARETVTLDHLSRGRLTFDDLPDRLDLGLEGMLEVPHEPVDLSGPAHTQAPKNSGSTMRDPATPCSTAAELRGSPTGRGGCPRCP